MSACKKPEAAIPAVSPQTPVLELLPSDVTTLESGSLQKNLAVSGSLRALQQASVKAKVAGEVKQVLVREGEAVKNGQILIKMDDSDYLARVEQSRASLRAAQGQLEIARTTRSNNRALKQQNFISQNALDTAENQYAIAQANVEGAKSALEVAQKALQDTVLRAPQDGLISARSVQPGEKVSPDARLLDVLDPTSLEVELSVPANEVAKISVGQAVQVTVEGLDKPLTAQLARISPATAIGTRSVLAYARLNQVPPSLRAGMFVQAKIVLASSAKVLKIARSALYADQTVDGTDNRAAAYLIEGGKLRKVSLRLGASGEDESGEVVEVLEAGPGVVAGATVIKTNLGNLNSGSSVKIAAAKPVTRPATPPAAPAAASASGSKP